MKKWIVLAIVVWVIALVSYRLIKSTVDTPVQALEKENKILRVVAENRELKWKIATIEDRLKSAAPKSPTRVNPVPNNANVNIK